MRSALAALAVLPLLAACRVPLLDEGVPRGPGALMRPPEAAALPLAGGAEPGNADGPGRFVARGSQRHVYAGAGGRLWYYTNCYYWAPRPPKGRDLWIKAEVVAEIRGLRGWPHGEPLASEAPKATVEYWRVGPGGRTVRIDNHKDYLLLSNATSAGEIAVRVPLTLGALEVRGRDGWERPREAYVLESRNYRGGGGVGADGARFVPDPREPVTVWDYAVPWSTHPERLTRSSWLDLEVPDWRLAGRRPPPGSSAEPVVTPHLAESAR